MLDIQEAICPWCGRTFELSEKGQKYCSNECCLEAFHATRTPPYGSRLHDGTRLLSDDFGELDGDELVTFQK